MADAEEPKRLHIQKYYREQISNKVLNATHGMRNNAKNQVKNVQAKLLNSFTMFAQKKTTKQGFKLDPELNVRTRK